MPRAKPLPRPEPEPVPTPAPDPRAELLATVSDPRFRAWLARILGVSEPADSAPVTKSQKSEKESQT